MATDKEKTRKALTLRSLPVGGEVIQVPLTYAQAIENRNALAKDLYSQLFNWLIKSDVILKGEDILDLLVYSIYMVLKFLM